MAAATYFDAVQKLYIAFYQRPADPAGLLYWAGQVDAKGGDQTAVVAAFATSAESTALYGAITAANIGTVVDAIYMALFNKVADAGGKKFYVDGFTAGTFTPGSIALNVLDGALNLDATSVANKLAVANSFTVAVDGRASTDASFGVLPLAATYDAADTTTARTYLTTVTSDVATVKTAAQVKADVEANIANAGDAILTKSFTLTTGSTDVIVGGAGNDSIKGDVAGLASARTLQATDSIDGGAGEDTLTATIGTNFTGFTTGSLKNVETVSLTSTAGVPVTFNATGVTDVKAYNLKGDVGLTNLNSAGVAVNLDSAQSAVTIGFTTKAVEGSADSLTLGLTNVGKADVSTTAADEQVNVAITAADIEAITINATGANVVSLANGAKAVVATGAGSLKVTDAGAATKTFDGSKLTGAVDLDLGAATSVTSVSGGAGDDVIRFNDELSATATVTGGAGANKLVANNGGVTVTQLSMSGVQTIELVNGAALTFSAAKSSGITTINVANNAAAGGLAADAAAAASTFADMGTAAITVNVTKSATAATLSSDHSGATTINYAGVATDTATARGDSAGTVTVSKSTGLTVNVAANANLTADADITAAKATSVTLVADGTLGTAGAVDISAASATSITANFKATGTSVVKFLAAKAASVEIATAGTLTLTDSTFSGTESLSITTTNKAVTGVGALAALSSATLGGTGNSAAITIGAVGGTTLAYGTSVTATGLKGGLTTGKFETGAGQSVNLQVAGVTGLVNVDGAVTVADSGADKSGAITVNAAAVGGAVTVGKLTAKTVNANFSNVGGTVTTDDFVGESVTVNFSGANALSAANTRDITAKTAVTYTGQGIANDATAITAATGSTALTVAITGGIGNDEFTINGVAGQTSITVTGDLGSLGTDTLTIATATSTVAQTISLAGISNYDTGTITTGSGADTITGGTGVDTITAGAGADKITTGAGADKVVVTVIATADTVADFTAGTGGDQIVFDFSDLVTGALVTLKDGNSAALANNTAMKVKAVSGATTAAAGDTVLVVTGATFATAAAMELAIENGGAHAVTLGSASAIGDDYLVAWSDGTNGHIGFMNASSAATTFAAASAYTELVTLTGVTSTTALAAFVDANFAMQA